MSKKIIYALLTLSFIGCGPKIVITEEPSAISNIKIKASQNCDIEKEEQ